MSERILVSICCLTFNHAPFIRKCLDGFLMQEGDFDIEVLIHDDASTDGTKEIIEEYKSAHPYIFYPIFQTENQGSKGGRSFTAKYNFPRCRGKYIALCEGDDYWTDSTKLKQQVEFLEQNNDYVLTGHDAIKITREGLIISQTCLEDIYKRDYSSTELKQSNLVLTLSMCFRNVSIIKYPPKESLKVKVGDLFIISMLGLYGKYKFMPNIKPAVYRVHTGGVWSLKSELDKNKMLCTTAKQLRNYYTRIGDKEMANYHSKKVLMYTVKTLNLSFENQKNLIQKIKCIYQFILDNKILLNPILFMKYIYFNKFKKRKTVKVVY